MSHPHEDTSGISAAMSLMLVLVAAVVIAIVVLAWSPWNDDKGPAPGQGGGDNEPRQEQRTPEPQRTPVMTPERQPTPATTPQR
jgi:hypothetical protein